MSKSFRSNQSWILAATISRHIQDLGARSLLDIGAGAGEVAVAISSQVSRYLAVERDPVNCAAVRLAGLDVIHASFPTEFGSQFDIVVSCYCLPEDLHSYEAFLTQAWKLVTPGGRLLVITSQRSVNSSLIRLSEELLGRKYGTDRRHTLVAKILRSFGEVSIGAEFSHVETTEASDLLEFRGPYFWSTEEAKLERRLRVIELIDAAYQRPGGYRVAVPHWVAVIDRESRGSRAPRYRRKQNRTGSDQRRSADCLSLCKVFGLFCTFGALN